jgi:hypothetical protein
MSEPRVTYVTAHRILLLLAVILAILAAFGVTIGTVSLLPLAIALLAAAFLV